MCTVRRKGYSCRKKLIEATNKSSIDNAIERIFIINGKCMFKGPQKEKETGCPRKPVQSNMSQRVKRFLKVLADKEMGPKKVPKRFLTSCSSTKTKRL